MSEYPDQLDAKFLLEGFSTGFRINYEGPRLSSSCKNLKSVLQNEDIAWEKVMEEVRMGRIAGPFSYKPISNLICSPMGLIPKKTGGFRLISHLSYPVGNSVNDFIDPALATVQYSNFDNAVNMIKKLGKGALIGKIDCKSAFRLLPCYLGDIDLLGFTLRGQYFVDKMVPMGLKIACKCWECFAKFLNWLISKRTGSWDIDHYLDDYFFAGEGHSDKCQELMREFLLMCQELGVPIAQEKTEGSSTSLVYLGYLLDTIEFQIRIPEEKIKNLLDLIQNTLSRKKLTLKELQSITGSLQFCAKAMPSARAFIRRMYGSMSTVKKAHHRIRLTRGIKDDLRMWQAFLSSFNGVSYMLDVEWVSSVKLQLYTDSAGGAGLGCGCYLDGAWAFLQWPDSWAESGILKDITFLEMVPIALAVLLWKNHFRGLRIQFNTDNMACLHILNSKSGKSERVMKLVRAIVLWSLQFDFHINAVHVKSAENFMDSISRKQWAKFKSLQPRADSEPTPVPGEFWGLLPAR